MWQAPEFGNDYVFISSYNNSGEVRVFRQLDKTSAQWSQINTIAAPPGTKVISVEPFIYNGNSYLFMSGVVAPDTFASTLFLSSIDPARPLGRQLTPDTPLRTRTDPEVFITSSGAYIYFNRINDSKLPPCPCPEGIYRTDTGLGPPLPP
jgi:hypothetical protein